jgi:hypothetical protein
MVRLAGLRPITPVLTACPNALCKTVWIFRTVYVPTSWAKS